MRASTWPAHSGFSPLGLYTCLYNADLVAIVAALLEDDYTVVYGPCSHTSCRRHDGWRLDTDAPFAALQNAVRDADITYESVVRKGAPL